MRNTWMSLSLAVVLGGSLTVLPGCGGGGGPAPVKKADAEISTARRSLDNAKTAQSQGNFDVAIAELNAAKAKIKEGLSFAGDSDKRTLRNIDEEVSDLLSRCEVAAQTARKPVAPKPADNTQVVAVDPNEAKKKAEEEKKKKEAEESAKRAAELKRKMEFDSKPVTKTEKQKDDEPAAANTAVKDPKKADKGEKGDKAEGADGGEEAAAKPKGVGPFPPVDEKSPELNIIKVTSNGKFAFAYFQLYNKNENGKRIMGVTAIFKDKDNAAMNQPNQAIVVPFEGFSEKAKDPTDNPNALTLGSHTVPGAGAIQLVAVVQHDRAKDMKKVGIRVAYDDQTSVADTGPSAAGGAAAEEKEDPDKTKVHFK